MRFWNLSHMPKSLFGPLNVHADICSQARGIKFGLSIHLHPFFVHACIEGSGQIHVLAQILIKKPSDLSLFRHFTNQATKTIKAILGNKF